MSILHYAANRKKGSGFFMHLILLAIFVFISAYFIQEVYPKRYVFSPRDATNVNLSHWKRKLYSKTIGKLKISDKFKNSLPKIPKMKPKRIIQKGGTKKNNPCNAINNVCLNEGICRSDGNEWYCDCPKSHYGKSCEFVAEQQHCTGNLCENNSTCYSVKFGRTVTNPKVHEVKKCLQDMMKGGNQKCNYTLNLMYKCWCRFGFEGDFCEFTEGMRCCAEDHCNNHGILEYNNSLKYDSGGKNGEGQKMDCENTTCTCECEQYYRKEDNCRTISPCRDFECFNGGICEENAGEPKCTCPNQKDFIFPINITITGEHCEQIAGDLENKGSCIPCNKGSGGFAEYIKCLNSMNSTLGRNMEDYFAKECMGRKCIDALVGGFCLNYEDKDADSGCQISVANLSNFDRMDSSANAQSGNLFLVPKCKCNPNFEGDFCENYLLDECDLEDLKNHRAFLETTGQTDKVLKTLGNESFLRTLKTHFYGWTPPNQEIDEVQRAKGFEEALRKRGMRTFCGAHGHCRPYIAEKGMDCKCDFGYKGTECEIWEPCKNETNPCSGQEGSLCVEIPIMDGDYADGGEKLTFACIPQ